MRKSTSVSGQASKSILLKAAHNQLHLSVVFLLERGNRWRMQVCIEVCALLVAAFRAGRRTARTHEEACLRSIRQAMGHGLGPLSGVIAVLSDVKALQNIGFRVHPDDANVGGLSRAGDDGEERLIAHAAGSLAVSLAKFEVRSQSIWFIGYPERFAAFLAETPAPGIAAVQDLLKDYATYVEVAGLPQARSREYKLVLDRSPFSKPVVRSTVAAAMRHFPAAGASEVPSPLRRKAHGLFHGFGSSAATEDNFHTAQGAEDKRGEVSLKKAWLAAINAGVLKGLNHFGEVDFHEQKLEARDPKTPPPSFQLPHRKRCSLKHVGSLVSKGAPLLPSLKAEHQATVVADIMGMRNLKVGGRLADFAATWRSALLVTGLVVRRKGVVHAWAISLGQIHNALSVPLWFLEDVPLTDAARARHEAAGPAVAPAFFRISPWRGPSNLRWETCVDFAEFASGSRRSSASSTRASGKLASEQTT